MSWLDGWLNQPVSWQARTASDSWEGLEYADAVTIMAWKKRSAGERPGPGGTTIPQNNLYYLNEDVQIGDKLDDEIVQFKEDLGPDVDGNFAGYVLRTEP